jgi:hypothetical protein
MTGLSGFSDFFARLAGRARGFGDCSSSWTSESLSISVIGRTGAELRRFFRLEDPLAVEESMFFSKSTASQQSALLVNSQLGKPEYQEIRMGKEISTTIFN